MLQSGVPIDANYKNLSGDKPGDFTGKVWIDTKLSILINLLRHVPPTAIKLYISNQCVYDCYTSFMGRFVIYTTI